MQVRSTTRRTRRSKVQSEKHIIQLKSGIHQGKYLVKAPNGRDELGRLTYKRFGPFADLAKATLERDKHLAKQIEQGRASLPLGRQLKAMTVAEWADHWLNVIVRQGNSAGSFARYSSAFKRHVLPSLGHLPLVGEHALTKMRIQQWQQELLEQGIGAPSVNYALIRLKTCLEAALDEASIGLKANMARKVKLLPEVDESDYQGHPSDYPVIVAALAGDYREQLPIIGVNTGLRRSELAALHWGDVDLAGRKITLHWHLVTSGNGGDRITAFRPGTKENQEGKIVYEEVHLSQQAVEAFKAHRERLLEHKMASRCWKAGAVDMAFYAAGKSDRSGRPYVVPQNPVADEALVFPSRDGTPYDPDILGDWFAEKCRSAGINKTLHGMRHDSGSFMLTANPPVPITVVKEHLRHASLEVTIRTYLHSVRGTERQGADALDAVWANLDARPVAI